MFFFIISLFYSMLSSNIVDVDKNVEKKHCILTFDIRKMLNFHNLVQSEMVPFQEYLRTLFWRIKTYNSSLLDNQKIIELSLISRRIDKILMIFRISCIWQETSAILSVKYIYSVRPLIRIESNLTFLIYIISWWLVVDSLWFQNNCCVSV